jgi:hypothetical protein
MERSVSSPLPRQGERNRAGLKAMTNKEGKRKLRVNYVNLDPGDQMEAAKRLQEEG